MARIARRGGCTLHKIRRHKMRTIGGKVRADARIAPGRPHRIASGNQRADEHAAQPAGRAGDKDQLTAHSITSG